MVFRPFCVEQIRDVCCYDRLQEFTGGKRGMTDGGLTAMGEFNSLNGGDPCQKYWDELVRSLPPPGADAAASVYADIVARYHEPQRHYHTVAHLEHLFRLLEEERENITDVPALIAAIFFHDAVYDPLSRRNEQDSAGLAARRLAELGAPESFRSRVTDLVLMTKTPEAPAGDRDAMIFLDLDMAIVVAADDAYRASAQAIRREYGAYSDHDYAAGRLEFLVLPMLEKERLFYTDGMEKRYAAQARRNLLAEKTVLERQRAESRPQAEPD